MPKRFSTNCGGVQLAITDEQLRIARSILTRVVPGAEYLVFGSRFTRNIIATPIWTLRFERRRKYRSASFQLWKRRSLSQTFHFTSTS